MHRRFCYVPGMTLALENLNTVQIRQRKEWGEIMLAFESRNKYEILDDAGAPLGFAAEQGKGLLATLARQFVGHWRTFELHFFDAARKPVMVAVHPFRFFFQRLEVNTVNGARMGALQQRFGILRKKFDVLDENDRVIYQMSAPIWKIWTFPFRKNGKQVAVIKKKWSGLLKEAFTDTDNFLLEFNDASLSVAHRGLMVAATIFVDLQFFETKDS